MSPLNSLTSQLKQHIPYATSKGNAGKQTNKPSVPGGTHEAWWEAHRSRSHMPTPSDQSRRTGSTCRDNRRILWPAGPPVGNWWQTHRHQMPCRSRAARLARRSRSFRQCSTSDCDRNSLTPKPNSQWRTPYHRPPSRTTSRSVTQAWNFPKQFGKSELPIESSSTWTGSSPPIPGTGPKNRDGTRLYRASRRARRNRGWR